MPCGVLLLMALLAVRCHLEHINVSQTDRFRQFSHQMNPDMAKLCGHVRSVTVHATDVLVGRGIDCADIVRHLVTACAPGSVLRSIVIRGSVRAGDQQECHRTDGDRGKSQESPHDRNLLSFQPRTRASEAIYATAMIVSTGLKPPLVT